jgi:hypothetical protein
MVNLRVESDKRPYYVCTLYHAVVQPDSMVYVSYWSLSVDHRQRLSYYIQKKFPELEAGDG